MSLSGKAVNPTQSTPELAPSLDETLLNRWIEKLEQSWKPGGEALLNIVRESGVEADVLALSELVRVDLDRHYQHNSTLDIRQYFTTFPLLLQNSRAATDIAFEEFRSRSSRGLPCSRARWFWIPGIKDCQWYRELSDTSERIGSQSEPSIDDEPTLGQSFGEFHLVCQLGTGAFSRVYLATQASLGSRFVALKVSRRTFVESQHLAQLQHTGIVPLYSVHSIGKYSALCMPYSGAATLQDWLRSTNHPARVTELKANSQSNANPVDRDGRSLIETVENCQSRVLRDTLIATESDDASQHTSVTQSDMDRTRPEGHALGSISTQSLLDKLRFLDAAQLSLWLGSRLSAALAHAHLRGIAHGDIKPANILIRNDGEPALIDFNLSRIGSNEDYRYVGGTLPYMAPEQLQSLIGRHVTVSYSSDVYALALVLVEVIVGRPAFPPPVTLAECDLQAALTHRMHARVDFCSASIPRGYAAILKKCLAYEPGQRYATAQELHEDIEAELHHRPLIHARESFASRLSKLTRRYPKAFSSTAVALVSLCVCGLIAWLALSSWNRAERLSATNQMNSHLAELTSSVTHALDSRPEDQLPEVLERLALHPSQADQPRFMTKLSPDQIAELQQAQYEACLTHAWLRFEKTPYMANHRAMSKDLLRACQSYPSTSQSTSLVSFLSQVINSHETLANKRQLSDPPLLSQRYQDAEAIVAARFLLWSGDANLALEHLRNVESTKHQGLLFWLTTGAAQLKLGQAESAQLSFSLAIAASPKSATAYHWRAQAEIARGNYRQAKDDFSRAIALQNQLSALYTGRALVRERLGELPEAIADIEQALALHEESTRLLFIQSRLYRKSGNRAKAAECLDAAEKREPISSADWISRAIAIADKNPHKSIADLHRALEIEPDSVSAWQNIAHIQSEYLKDEEASLAAINQILTIQPNHQEGLSGRAVLLSRLKNMEQAVADINTIRKQFPKPLPATIYQVGCAYAQLSQDEPKMKVQAIEFLMRALQQGYGADILKTDPDLDPLRNDPEFNQLVQLADFLRR